MSEEIPGLPVMRLHQDFISPDRISLVRPSAQALALPQQNPRELFLRSPPSLAIQGIHEKTKE